MKMQRTMTLGTMVAFALLLFPSAGAAATFTVTSAADLADKSLRDGVCDDGTGQCTLRAAIQQGNTASSPDTIAFDLPGSGVHTVAPGAALPSITQPLTIDGYTQPGSSANTLGGASNAVLTVQLDGEHVTPPAVAGLDLRSPGIVRGLVINRFGGAQVELGPGSGVSTIAGNFIGPDPTGTVDPVVGLLSQSPGIRGAGCSASTIGGDTPADRNLVSANHGSGVDLSACGFTQVRGNLIGLDRTGTHALPNHGNGIDSDATNGVTLGGTDPAARNVVSGNLGAGIVIGNDASTTANVVEGDYVGTTVGGAAAVPNNGTGVAVLNAHDNTIGGTSSGAGNVISGNGAEGVEVGGLTPTHNVIAGNLIGTTATGGAGLGNFMAGVRDAAPSTTIGGTEPAARNVISGNAGDGITSTGDGLHAVGNYVGTTPGGGAPLPNGGDGVRVVAADAQIGGRTAAERNVISGNDGNGVRITGSSAPRAAVLGNRIGTGAGGTVAVPNGADGVRLDGGAAQAAIGSAGSSPGATPGNLIAGNGGSGVDVAGGSDARVDGNEIGIAADGTSALGNGDDGVTVRAGAVRTQVGSSSRNVISGNEQSGVLIAGSATSGTIVNNSFIGTSASGSAPVPNDNGVEVASGSQGDTIAHSVISGNRNEGVLLDGSATTDHAIVANFIGLDAAGTGAVPNRQGVVVSGGAQFNTIGGTSADDRNFIAGNTAEGVLLTGPGTNRNVVRGDFLGTRQDGLAAVANGTGVSIAAGARDNTVGGSSSTPTTLVSGNTVAGVRIADPGTRNNRVQAAVIGLDKNLAAAVPNATGVLVANGAVDTTIGGSSASLGNVIARNAHSGVEISGNATTGTDVARTRTFLDGGLGINLRPGGEGADLVTQDDPGDGDSGPNALQNFPVLTAVAGTAAGTTVNGTLNSTPNASFRIDVFRNPAGTGASAAEGQDYVGSATASTDGSGNASFTFTVSSDLSGQVFTASATNTVTRNTSELSAARTAA